MGLEDISGFLMGLATGTLMGGALGFMFVGGPQPQQHFVQDGGSNFADPTSGEYLAARRSTNKTMPVKPVMKPGTIVTRGGAYHNPDREPVAPGGDAPTALMNDAGKGGHMTQQQLSEIAAKAAVISREFKERQREYFDLREQIRELQKLDISAKISETAGTA